MLLGTSSIDRRSKIAEIGNKLWSKHQLYMYLEIYESNWMKNIDVKM